MSSVQHHLYKKIVFVFGFEQFYGRFLPHRGSFVKAVDVFDIFGCELGFMSGYKPY
jgi:hypothetical protein